MGPSIDMKESSSIASITALPAALPVRAASDSSRPDSVLLIASDQGLSAWKLVPLDEKLTRNPTANPD